jgi:hypothetical protein
MVVFGNKLMIFPVKIFRPIKKKLKLIRTYTIKYLKKRSDEKFKKIYVHPTVKRLTKKEKEEQKKNV